MYHIFISYRRQDSEDVTTRIAEWLIRKIPPTYVYFDTRSINPGDDFPSDIRRAVIQARVVLAVIGPEWPKIQATDGTFRRRIELPDDWVHQELALALQDPTKVVIPLLLHGESMPKELGIPLDIRPLVTLNAVPVLSESAQFEMAMVRVARRITAAIPQFRLDGATLIDMGGPRQAYLEAVSERYRFLRLPMNPQLQLPLDTIYQPLRLHKDPFLPAANKDDLADDSDPRDQGERTGDRRERAVERERRQMLEAPLIRGTYAQDGEDALALSESRRLVILGKPGTGKTTLLYRFMGCAAQRALNDEQAPLPLFISLPQLARADAEYDMVGYLQTLPELQNITHFATDLSQAVNEGNIYLCMDGLDEVSPRQRGAIITWLNSLKRGERKTSAWIIGSRFAEYKGQEFASAGYVEWEMDPLDDAQRQKLARALIQLFHHDIYGRSNLTIRSPQRFVQALVAHNQAQSWRDNPMLFSLAAYVFVKQGRLPAARSDLYHIIIDAVLLRTEQADEDRSYQIKRAVAELALMLFQYQGRTFTRQTMRDYLPRVCQRLSERWDWPQMLKDIINSGLLDQVGRDEYRFFHQTFHEYLAADALAFWLTDPEKLRMDDTRRFIEHKRTRNRWSEILSLMVGIVLRQRGKAGAAFAQEWMTTLTTLYTTPNGDPGFLALKQAIHTLVEIPPQAAYATLAETALTTWIDLTLSFAQGNRYTQHSFLQHNMLLAIGSELNSLPPHIIEIPKKQLALIIADNSRSSQERTDAITLIGRHMAAADLLMLRHDKEDQVRYVIIQFLKERVLMEDLLPFLHDDSSFVRLAAIQALAKQVPVEDLLPLVHDDDLFVKETAVQALAARAPIEDLLPLLQDDFFSVRQSAVQALGNRAPATALLLLLNDDNSNVRASALLALTPRRTSGDLLHILAKQDKEMLIAAITFAGKRAPVDVLQLLLQDDNWQVRPAAVLALAEQTPAENLLPFLHDDNWLMRKTAIQVLAERTSMEELLLFLQDDSWQVRQATIQAIAGRASVEDLLPLLQDSDSDVRQAAIQALDEQAPVEDLLPFLHDANWRVQVAAVLTLINRVPLEDLLSLLHNTYWRVQEAAVLALTNRVPLGDMLPLLDEVDPRVRAAAIQALAEQVPVENLLPLLRDKNWLLRRAAVLALAKRTPIENLLPLLHDEDDDVRQAAVQALAGRAPVANLLPLVHDDSSDVIQAVIQTVAGRVPVADMLPHLGNIDGEIRQAAYQAIKEHYAESLPKIEQEAMQVLSEQAPGPILGSISRSNIALTLGSLSQPQAEYIQVLDTYLSWHYWQVRLNAANALGSIQRGIPDEVITHLFALRRDDPVQRVREAADDALAQILSVDTIEDD